MKRTVLACIGLLLLQGCATENYGSLQSTTASALIARDGVNAAYTLGPGDKLEIVVYGEDNLSSEQQVGADGTVTMPLIGRVPASGRTVTAVTDEMRTKLGDGFVHNPSVSVTIKNYRPFYILGEVTTPGQYEYAQGMTLLAAVAKAGGFTYRAKRTEIFLKREGIPTELQVALDGDMPIHPGDTIRIRERYF